MFRKTVFLCAAATLLAETPLPELRTEPIDAGSVFFVRNRTAQPLTGYVIELVDYPGSYFGLWRDELGEQPVAPGQERRIPTTNMTVGASPEYCKITAAIYADGSAAGSAERIAQFRARRQHLQATAKALMAKLQGGASAADLNRWAESIPVPGKRTPITQSTINDVAGRGLIGEIAAQTQSGSGEAAVARLQRLISAK